MKNILLYNLLLIFIVSSCDDVALKDEQKQDSSNGIMPQPLPNNNYFITEMDTSYLERIFLDYDLVNIKTLDSNIRVRLAYADTNNFLHKNIYHGLRNAYFNCETAIKIVNAQHFLKIENTNYTLLILDAARPHHIQQLMWDSLKMDAYYKHCYLSPPYEKSLHNYACAVDVTILDVSKNEVLDMGTNFDYFGKKSQPVFEDYYLKTGELSDKVIENRGILRKVMVMAGMKPINSEWWHFASFTKEEANKKFELIK